jgi:hypothetical protein
MVATGNHKYFYSLRGAPRSPLPKGEGIKAVGASPRPFSLLIDKACKEQNRTYYVTKHYIN